MKRLLQIVLATKKKKKNGKTEADDRLSFGYNTGQACTYF